MLRIRNTMDKRRLPANVLITCTAVQFDSINNARWIELDYSKHLQRLGPAVDIQNHETFIYPSGSGMTCSPTGSNIRRIVRPIHPPLSSSWTHPLSPASRVIYVALNSDEHSDIAKSEGVALNIAARIFDSGTYNPCNSRSRPVCTALLESYGWLERVLD